MSVIRLLCQHLKVIKKQNISVCFIIAATNSVHDTDVIAIYPCVMIILVAKLNSTRKCDVTLTTSSRLYFNGQGKSKLFYC